LFDLLVAMERPASGPAHPGNASALLQRLADGQIPLTHDAFHELQPWRTIAHLEELLVTSGVLPAADKYICSFQRRLPGHPGARQDNPAVRILRAFSSRSGTAPNGATSPGLGTEQVARNTAWHSLTGSARRLNSASNSPSPSTCSVEARPSGREGTAKRSHPVVFRFLSVAIGRLLGVSRYRLQPSPAQEAALLEHCGDMPGMCGI
jgi:hypothetical protein